MKSTLDNISSKSVYNYFYASIKDHYSEEEARSITFIILEDILGIKKTEVLADKETGLSEKDYQKTVRPYLVKLKKHTPVQHITGKSHFYGLELKVNNSVLIPRPETEELVDLILGESSNVKGNKVLDLCTGSGCIAIALKKYLTNTEISALDISSAALQIAKENAKLNNVDIDFIKADLLNPNFKWEESSYWIVVSNPPYVMLSEQQLMQPNVLNHEPWSALFVDDADPLLFYKIIAKGAAQCLKKGGRLYFEINERFGEAVKDLLLALDFKKVTVVKDLNGKDRIVKALVNK